MRKRIIIYGCIFFVWVLYYILALIINHKFGSSSTNYYPYLINSLLHKKVYIIHPPSTYDLSLYNNKWFLNWGPGAILYILPFYFFEGIYSSDVLFTLLAGMINVVMFYLALKEIQKAFNIRLSLWREVFILLTFALASANFFMSLSGRIWFSEQVIGIFYLLICYFFYFRYIQQKKLLQLFLAILFFNLAWITRYTLIFSGFLFLYPLYLSLNKFKKVPIAAMTMIISVTIFFISLVFAYNFAKFNNPFETGLSYHRGSPLFASIIRYHQFFSPKYINYNATYYFSRLPTVFHTFPFLQFDLEGNSIFFMYPATLFLLFLLKRSVRQKLYLNSFLFFSMLSIFATLFLFLCYFTTGWKQLGLRYLLDITPLLYLLLVFVIDRIALQITIIVLLYEILLHIDGVIWFYRIII